MIRFASAAVSLMGSLGLALAAGYLLLIFRAFQPGGEAVTEFLVGRSDGTFGWGFMIVIVPYALLLAHLWFRIRLGDWMLSRGAVDEALSYASRRMRSNPLRARKEALAHRVTVMRVHVRRGDYEEAWRVASEAGKLGRPNPWQTRFLRWQLEIALRRENLVDAHAVVDAVGAPRERSAEAAAFHSAAAEVAVRENVASVARERLESARWAQATPAARALVAEALRAAKFELEEHALQRALEGLDAATRWLAEVPGFAGEWAACRARLLVKLGRHEEARAALASPPAAGSDARSHWVFEQTKKEISDEQDDGPGD